MLSGNEDTVEALRGSVGHTISGIKLDEGPQGELILIGLNNGKTLTVSDQGQSCCESRYITTDADLPYYIGATIIDFELRDMPSIEKDFEFHDAQAFVISTSAGVIDFVTHVEHNGYYGGFSISANLKDYAVAGLK